MEVSLRCHNSPKRTEVTGCGWRHAPEARGGLCENLKRERVGAQLTKAWTAINRLPIIWKSDLTDKMKRSFFQAAVTSILLYGCTTWTLTKRLEKKLDGNYTRMLRAVLNRSWRQHPTRHQLYGHLPPITKTIQVRRTRREGSIFGARRREANLHLRGPLELGANWIRQHRRLCLSFLRRNL